jgi:RHS repeat-associated protein
MEYDSETQLYHTLFRYYNPRLGLWMTPDPAGLGASSLGDPQTLNRYAYVMNDPINMTDSLGLWCDGDGHGVCDPWAAHGGGFLGLNEFDLLNIALNNPVPVTAGCVITGNCDRCWFPLIEWVPDLSILNLLLPDPADPAAKRPSKTLNCAALNATNAIVPEPKAQGIEFGGFIYQSGAASMYSYTAPFSGTPGALPSFYSHMGDVPSGASIVGWYHSHPLVPGYPAPENFSGGDLAASRYLHAPGFLVTPSGQLLRLDPVGRGRVTRINKSKVCQGN